MKRALTVLSCLAAMACTSPPPERPAQLTSQRVEAGYVQAHGALMSCSTDGFTTICRY